LLYLGSFFGLAIARAVRGNVRSEAALQRRDLPGLAGAIVSGGILAPVLLVWGLSGLAASAASLLLAAEAGERDDAVRERARADEVHRYEHDVAVSLQRALLPRQLVGDRDVALAATYRPSDQRLEVGGDWYETLALPGDRIGVAVGDVVGHGLEAAAAMGQLRTAVAALGPDCASPVDLLDQLDEFQLPRPRSAEQHVHGRRLRERGLDRHGPRRHGDRVLRPERRAVASLSGQPGWSMHLGLEPQPEGVGARRRAQRHR
jgi:hypothetical protein